MVLDNERHIANTAPELIPSSVRLPIEIALRYMPEKFFTDLNGVVQSNGRGRVWDVGTGNGNTLDLLDFYRFAGWGWDINAKAVEQINTRVDRFAEAGDIRKFGDGAGLGFIHWLESVDAMHIQALGPSLLGNSWKQAYKSMDVALCPGGYIFLADFARPDLIYPELIGAKHTMSESLSLAQRWNRRMDINMQAFGDLALTDGQGFPYGAVAVAKPGEGKQKYDWSEDPKQLRTLYDQGGVGVEGVEFERFAQNMDIAQFREFMKTDLGYVEKEWNIVEWSSRNPGYWYPGLVAVLQKPFIHRYHPWKIGLDPREEDHWDKWKGRKHEVNELVEIEVLFSRLLEALSDWDNDQPVVREIASHFLSNYASRIQKLADAGYTMGMGEI